METLSNIVDALFRNLMELMPFVIINSYQRGVRWSFGKNPVELLPGFHWKLWLYHEIALVVVVDDAIHLPGQTVTCQADGKVYYFKVSFGFRIFDAVKHYCNVREFKESTIAIAMRHLAKRVRTASAEDLLDPAKLEKSLENTLTTQFKGWGTEVFTVGFTDFAEIKTRIRLFGDDEVFNHVEA